MSVVDHFVVCGRRFGELFLCPIVSKFGVKTIRVGYPRAIRHLSCSLVAILPSRHFQFQCLGERERETETETDRQTDRQTDREKRVEGGYRYANQIVCHIQLLTVSVTSRGSTIRNMKNNSITIASITSQSPAKQCQILLPKPQYKDQTLLYKALYNSIKHHFTKHTV